MADDDEGDSLSSYSISLPTITAAIGIHGISYDTVASRVVHHDDRATKNGPTPVDSAGPWTEEIDPQTGSTFYYNYVSHESRWERPPDMPASAPGPQSGQKEPSSEADWFKTAATCLRVKRTWRALVDSNTGSTYYVDDATGVSQWEEPTEVVDVPPPETNTLDEGPGAQDTGKVATTNQEAAGSGVEAVARAVHGVSPDRQHNPDGARGSVGGSTSVDPRASAVESGEAPAGVGLPESSDTSHRFKEKGASFLVDEGDIIVDPGDASEDGARHVSLRPTVSRRHQPHHLGAKPNSPESPAVAFTAWRTPNSESAEFVHEFAPDTESAPPDHLMPCDTPRSDQAGETHQGIQLLERNSEEAKRGEGEGSEKEKSTRSQKELARKNETYKIDAFKEAGSEDDTQGDGLVREFSFGIDTKGKPEEAPGTASCLPPPQDRSDQWIEHGELLPRIDSSSTLSTYGEGLDSLAQYVAGHSSTLEKGAVVQLALPNEGETGDTTLTSTHNEHGKSARLVDEEVLRDTSITTSGTSRSSEKIATGLEIGEGRSEVIQGMAQGKNSVDALSLVGVHETDRRGIEGSWPPSHDDGFLGDETKRSTEASDERDVRNDASDTQTSSKQRSGSTSPNDKDAGVDTEAIMVSSMLPPLDTNQEKQNTPIIEERTLKNVPGEPADGEPVAKCTPTFDTAAVTSVALQRLRAGMVLTRQRAASVTLQAQARGWAARRHYARLSERDETRKKEEFEARQRAATAIQSAARGLAAKKEWQALKIRLRNQHAARSYSTEGNTDFLTESSIETTYGRVEAARHTEDSPVTVLSESMQQRSEPQAPKHDGVDDNGAASQHLSESLSSHADTSNVREERCTPKPDQGSVENGNGGSRPDEWYEQTGDGSGSPEGGMQKSDCPSREQWDEQGAEVMRSVDDLRIEWPRSNLDTVDKEGEVQVGHAQGTAYSEKSTNPDKTGNDAESPNESRIDDREPADDSRVLDHSDETQLAKDEESDSETDCVFLDGSIGEGRKSRNEGSARGGRLSELNLGGGESGSDGTVNRSRQESISSQESSESTSTENTVENHDADDGGADSMEKNSTDRVTTPGTSATDDGSQDSVGVALAGDHVIGGEAFLDTMAPLEKLENLRSLVAGQAEATARIAMAMPGTEVSRREATRLRELAVWQEQGSSRFLEAIRHSIATDVEHGAVLTHGIEGGASEGVHGRDTSVHTGEGTPEPKPNGINDALRSSTTTLTAHEVDGAASSSKDQANEEGDGGDAELLGRRMKYNGRGTGDTVAAALALTSDLSRLALRQDKVAAEVFQAAPGEHGIDSQAGLGGSEAIAALNLSVGLQARAVGLMEEVVARTVHSRLDARVAARAARKGEIGRAAEYLANDVKLVAARHQRAAKRMEAVRDAATARDVIDDIRGLAVVQERLISQIQQFIVSTRVADLNTKKADSESNNERDAEGPREADEEGETTAVVKVQERITRLAMSVARELRKGVDAANVACTRAQTIHRGSKVERFADELRVVAWSQTAASSTLAEAAAQFVSDSLAEQPLPRNYALPYRDTGIIAVETSSAKQIDGGSCAPESIGIKGRLHADVVGVRGSSASARHVEEMATRPNASAAPTVASVAIEVAAGKEKAAAAARIRPFLRRRLLAPALNAETAVLVGGIKCPTPAAMPASAVKRGDGGGWLEAAVRSLRQAVDLSLLGNEELDDADADLFPARSTPMPFNKRGFSQIKRPKSNNTIVNVGSRTHSKNGTRRTRTDDVTRDRVASERTWGNNTGDDHGRDGSPTFPPVPLRARAPSLYTLPTPERLPRGHGGGYGKATSIITGDNSTTNILTKIDLEVAARLSSARSVFSLRATDVLTAFSPPPPYKFLPVTTAARLHRSTEPGTAGHEKPGRNLSPDALRQRLRAEAENASRSGLGRPWGSPRRPLSSIARRNRPTFRGDVEGGRGERARRGKRRADLTGTTTALGRRLEAKRVNFVRKVRRKRMLGETDALRARHVGRQLCSGTAASALDGVGQALNARESRAREKSDIPPAHMGQLLDAVDRFVFSDSQLCNLREETPTTARGAAENDGNSQGSRCHLCQEILDDLRQNFTVVREQSSWGDDTNPFCCSLCGSSPVSQTVTPRTDNGGKGQNGTFESTKASISPCPASESSAKADEDLSAAHGDSKGGQGQDAFSSTGMSRTLEGAAPPTGNDNTDMERSCGGLAEGKANAGKAVVVRAASQDMSSKKDIGRLPRRKPDTVAADFSAHLHGVDKYPLELARLCRFAQFLAENNLLREAYEVILHAISSSTIGTSNSQKGNVPSSSFPQQITPGLGGQLSLVAGRLAVAVGRYSEAVRHLKTAVRSVTISGARESPAILVAASRVFESLLDDHSAEVLLLGCLVQQPDYPPALSSYGRLVARKGELCVAERYLTRATSLPSDAAKDGGGNNGDQASGWINLMELLSDYRQPTNRGADVTVGGVVCNCNFFRKALACLNWKHPGQGTPSSVATTAGASAAPSRPSARVLQELGRFELHQNRSMKRARAFFKTCLDESPWHASAKVHLACCLLEQLGPVQDGRAPSRAVLRIDALLRSVLCHDGYGHPTTTPKMTSSLSPPHPDRTAILWGKAAHPLKTLSPLQHHRESWLLWALYAKFAERCMGDPRLALHALDRASVAARGAGGWSGLEEGRGGRGESLVARAQLCQRWPELIDGAERSRDRARKLEEMFVDATQRYPEDPVTHTALGYFFISTDERVSSLRVLDKAATAFERAKTTTNGDAFLPSTRGLAVVARRRALRKAARGWRAFSAMENDAAAHQERVVVEESPRDVLLHALESSATRGRESVALLRTTALHLYSWRALVDPHGTHTPSLPASSKKVDAVASVSRAVDERQAEGLLVRAIELEPFHAPTLAALAFALLQHGGNRAIRRAEGLLEKAVKCAGRGAPADVLRVLARIRESQGRRSSAMCLFRRAAATGTEVFRPRRGDDVLHSSCRDDPLSLCGLAQLLLSPRRRNPDILPPPVADRKPGNDGVDGGMRPETELDIPVVKATEVLLQPSDEDKDEAAGLLARAFSAAGGGVPLETLYFGRCAAGDDSGSRNNRAGLIGEEEEGEGGQADRSEVQGVLPEVHLAVSGFSIEGRGRSALRHRGGGGKECDVAKQWHLREAARAGVDTKTGLSARYIIGRLALAAGDDRKAEVLFLEALDAEPTTYGACAAFLSVLRQVSVDLVQAKARSSYLRRRLRKTKGRRGSGGSLAHKKTAAASLSRHLEVVRRAIKLLARLEVYASLRKRYAGDRLQGPGLASLEWALALEEGWELRYTTALEGGDGWAAMHRLR